jgi:predicted oxidoreductase
VQVAPTLAKAFGGVWVNLSGQALRENGEPIAGLYAAGEVSGMAGGGLVGPTGHGFTGSLSAVIYSGRRAAWGALGSL